MVPAHPALEKVHKLESAAIVCLPAIDWWTKFLDFSWLRQVFACESKSSSRDIVGVREDFAEWRKYERVRVGLAIGTMSQRIWWWWRWICSSSKMLSCFRHRPACASWLRLAQRCLSASQDLAIYGESQDSFWCTPQSRLQGSARHKIRNFISKMIIFEKNSVC